MEPSCRAELFGERSPWYKSALKAKKPVYTIDHVHAPNILTDQLVSVNFNERILKGDTSQTVYRTVDLCREIHVPSIFEKYH